MEVLTAFIRERSLEQWPLPDAEGRELKRRTRPDMAAVAITAFSLDPSVLSAVPGPVEQGWTRPDVQAAITVVGRRNQEHDISGNRLDLTGASLTGANLIEARLHRANLSGADLSGASLDSADFSEAFLLGADLSRAALSLANLSGAILLGANLSRADLSLADLSGAGLTGANLSGANLGDAFLTGATLIRANLSGANLRDADLSRAILSDALWPQDAAVPEGWKRDTSSGRLSAAGTGGETPEAG
jgi:uncharacterized protein YjbI with pentapeptide repeats